MKYRYDFEVSPDRRDERYIEYKKKDGGSELGVMIQSNIGYRKEEIGEKEKYVLEIEVFSSEQWRQFKEELRQYIEAASQINLSTFNLIVVGKMIKKLESCQEK